MRPHNVSCVIPFTILPLTVCISAGVSFRRNCRGTKLFHSTRILLGISKNAEPLETLDTFPTEVRRFRVLMIEEIRISPVYSGATGFCCKRIPFIPENSLGVGPYPGCCTYRLFSRLIHELLRVIRTSKAPLVVHVFIVSALACITAYRR